jgi:hypothetical protein
MVGEEYTLLSFLLCSFLHSPVTSSLLFASYSVAKCKTTVTGELWQANVSVPIHNLIVPDTAYVYMPRLLVHEQGCKIELNLKVKFTTPL